jgi:TonB family protein
MLTHRCVSLFAALGLCAVLLASAPAPARAQYRVQYPGEVVSPTWPPPVTNTLPPQLRFRGGPPSVTGDAIRQWDGQRLRAGRYLINSDPHDVVQVKLIQDGRASIESPGEWSGTGVLTDSSYWGVFEYKSDAREPKNRGARGTHWGTIDAEGRVHIEGRFTNRPWPPFTSVWTRESESAVFRADSAGVMRRHSITREELERIPVDVPDARSMRPPVWPPPQMHGVPRGETPPSWPQEWYHGGTQLLFIDPDYSVRPVVTHMVPLQMGETVPKGGGLVVVRITIGRDGSVESADIARSVPGLDEAALRAVRLWRFRPAMRAGEPVIAIAYVPFLLAAM